MRFSRNVSVLGSSIFCLDGVPFTLSEKWKAPKKVGLKKKHIVRVILSFFSDIVWYIVVLFQDLECSCKWLSASLVTVATVNYSSVPMDKCHDPENSMNVIGV